MSAQNYYGIVYVSDSSVQSYKDELLNKETMIPGYDGITYKNSIAFLGSTGQIASKGQIYGKPDNFIEDISGNNIEMPTDLDDVSLRDTDIATIIITDNNGTSTTYNLPSIQSILDLEEVVSTAFVDQENDIDDISSKIVNINSSINSILSDNIENTSVIDTSINLIDTSVNLIETNLLSVNSSVSTLEAKTISLDTSVNLLQNKVLDISAVNIEVPTSTDTVSFEDTDIATIYTQQGTNSSTYKLPSLQSLFVVKSNINSIDSSLSILNSSVQDLFDNSINIVATNIDIPDTLADVSIDDTDIATITVSKGSETTVYNLPSLSYLINLEEIISSALVDQENSIDNLTNSNNINTNDISTLKSTITTLESRIQALEESLANAANFETETY